MKEEKSNILNYLVEEIETLFIPYSNHIKSSVLSILLINLCVKDFKKDEFLDILSVCWDDLVEEKENEGG